MVMRFSQLYLLLVLLLLACGEKIESPESDLQRDFQPLEIGNFWIYQVDETIHYGENDSESSSYFYRDLIRGSYLNAENEVVYIVSRSRSEDRVSWTLDLEYTQLYRDRILLRTTDNSPLAALVFPPELGRLWNGKAYQAEGDDDFEIDGLGPSSLPGFEEVTAVRVNQENLDDKITIRDIRYEIYGKGVGLLEKYDEVLTYCSRNDCLGNQLIDGGSKTHLTLIDYGKE